MTTNLPANDPRLWLQARDLARQIVSLCPADYLAALLYLEQGDGPAQAAARAGVSCRYLKQLLKKMKRQLAELDPTLRVSLEGRYHKAGRIPGVPPWPPPTYPGPYDDLDDLI